MKPSAKARVRVIDQLLKKHKNNEEYVYQIRNGFVAEALTDEYNEALTIELSKDNGPDTDTDKAQYSNWFYLHPEKVIGKEVKGSGYINPVNTVGSITELDEKIPFTIPNLSNNMAKKEKNKPENNNPEIGIDLFEDHENIPADVQAILDAHEEGLVDGDYNELAIAKSELEAIGYTFDYYLDGTPYDLRKIGQKGKVELESKEVDEKTSTTKTEPLQEKVQKDFGKNPNIHFVTPGVKEEKKSTSISENLKIQRLKQPESAKDGPELLSIEDSLKKYNPSITDAEIKGWVYYKRSYGNPMRGWEKYFLKESKTKEILIYSKIAFYLKDNHFRDTKMIPSDTLIGKKTKFKNEYDNNTYIVIKAENGDLVYVDDKNVTEKTIGNAAATDELMTLVKEKGLCYNNGEFLPIPLYAYGNIYDIKDSLIGKFNREANKYEGGYFPELVKTFGQEIADWHLKLVDDAIKIKGEYYFDDAIASKRPFLSSENPISKEFKVKRLNDESGVDFEKIFENNKKRQDRYKAYDEEANDFNLFQAYEEWFKANVNDSQLEKTTKRNIIDFYFNNRKITGSSEMTDKEKDEIRLNARIEGEKFYAEFLATALTKNDITALNITFNRKYNSISKINLDKVPVAFETNARIFSKAFSLLPVQRNGIAFMAATNSGCLAYDVGFGKTLTAIHNLASLLKQGAIKRPLIVVPKQVYNNWIREMFGFWTDGKEKRFEKFEGASYVNGALTGTKYKLNTWFNLSAKIEFKNALLDPDTITLLTYEGFYKLGFSRELAAELFDDLYTVLTKGRTDATARQEEKEKENVKKMMGIGIADTVIDIDTCGFDYLVFDEAHAFKNVFNSVPLDEGERNVWRLSVKSQPTKRAVKAFFHSLYIQKKYSGNVQLLTATPFTNSPLEIFSMLSLVGYETLKKYNLQNLFEFLGLFIETEVEYTVNYANEIVLNTVIKSFKNKNLLRDILYRHFDYQDDPKTAQVKRPCKINFPNKKVNTYLEMSPQQQKGQQIVRDEAASFDPKYNRGAMGRALNWAKNNSFSPYLLKAIVPYETLEELIDESPKLKYTLECIASVKKYHEKRGEEMSGQVIYANRGVGLFEDFKRAIEERCSFKRGVQFGDSKVDEIEIIMGGGSDKELEHKELVKDAFNKGYCKIIIGTGTIKEGVNLQERGTTLYNLDLDWNPTDFKQLEGRIHRQGNRFKYVRIIVPLVQNTLDSFINQKLDEKSKRIASIWDKNNQSNQLEDYSAVDPLEIKFALIDDENELMKMKVEKDLLTAQKNSTISKEKYEAISKIDIAVTEFNETFEHIKTEIAATFENHKIYVGYLEKYTKKAELSAGEKTSIKDLIEKLNENIVLFEDYYANGNFKSLFEVFRMLGARSYNFKTITGSQKDYADLVEMYTGKAYYGDIETYQSYYAKKLIAAYGDMKKLERMVLQPYGLTVNDNFEGIKKKFKKEHEGFENEVHYLNSIEYKEQAMGEIRAELKKRALERGSIKERVREFESFNYLLSYPFIAETADACEMPHDADEYSGPERIMVEELEKQDEDLVEVGDLKSNNTKRTTAKPKEEDFEKPIQFSKLALEFVPKSQVAAAKSWEYNEAKERINDIVKRIPSYNESKDEMVYLHYFKGGSDYFVMETDFDDNYKNVYGYAILNEDYQNAELGSQGLDELKKYMELDFYFKPIPLKQALAAAGHPKYEEFKETEPADAGTITLEDYKDSLAGAEIALEFSEGQEKQDLIDYIDGLKIAIEFM